MLKNSLPTRYKTSLEAIESAMDELDIDFTKDSYTAEEVSNLDTHFSSQELLALEGPSLAVTDDEILAVAERTNIELDVVMQAAQKCQTLSFLVKWAEEYQSQKSAIEQEKASLAIKESVSRHIELENLTHQEKDLQARLVSALTPTSSTIPSVSDIEKMLGIETPESARSLAKSDYTGEEAPDFLLQARSLIKIK